MIDLTTIHIHTDGLRIPLLECPHLRSVLGDEIDYLEDLNLDGLRDEPAVEMED
jgi:hypothetical protein